MGGILSFLTGPFKGVMDGAADIINKFVASPEDKLKAQQALLQVQADLQTKLIEADGEFAKQQAGVVTAEVQSASWLARNWRPLLMLTFTFVIAWNYIIAPLFALSATPIPPDMYELLKIGIGGYIFGRSAEKITPSIADALSSKKS